MDDFIYSICTSGLFSFLLLFVFVSLGTILFVWRYPLPKRVWSCLDLLWLFFAAVGLFGLTHKNRVYIAEYLSPIQEKRISIYSDQFFSWGNRLFEHKNFVRSEYSPSNYDELLKNYELNYEKFVNIYPRFGRTIESMNLIDLSLLAFPLESDVVFTHDIGELIKSAMRYNDNVLELNESKTLLENKHSIFDFLAPLLLVIGLSIRITKSLNEIFRGGDGTGLQKEKKPEAKYQNIPA